MWNQKFDARTYENDSFERFGRGIAAVVQRRLGLGAAHGGQLEGRRPHGRGAGHGRGEPGQRQPRLEQGAGHPPGVRRAGLDRGRAAVAGKPVLQHARARHRDGHQPPQAASGRDPADQRQQAVLQGAAQELSGGPAHRPDRRGVPSLDKPRRACRRSSPRPRRSRTTTTSRPAATWPRAPRKKSCRWTKPWSCWPKPKRNGPRRIGSWTRCWRSWDLPTGEAAGTTRARR